MAREKGAPPLRRLPSRSGRASFEADPNGQEDADTSSSPPFSSATTTKNISGVGGSEVEQEGKEAAQGPFEEYRKPSVSNGILTGRHAVNDAQGATSAAAVTTTAVPTSASRATTPVTPRCLGRPKKKPLKVKVDDTDNSASTPRVVTVGMPRSSADSTASISTAVAGVPTTSVATAAAEVNGAKLVNAHGASINDTSSGGDKTGVLAKQEQEEQDEEGNESDEWSEHDEIHYLPKETKAQFGNIVWAKWNRDPPWPALVYDPRFLGRGATNRQVAQLGYSGVGKSHLVKFYTLKQSFATVPYKSILPFDPSDLPIHLKACKTPKKKETLRDDVQSAIKASLLTRSERLAEMHEIGRWTANEKKRKNKKKVPSKKNSTPVKKSSAPAKTGTPGKTAGKTPKKRSRGRPRKESIQELDDDPPSPSSSGAEYELEVPEDLEEEEDKEFGDTEAEGEEEEEEEKEDEDDDEEDGEGGDDDDEEEYTAEAEPDDEEDDKELDEDFIKAKGARKRGRGWNRKSSSGGRRGSKPPSARTDDDGDTSSSGEGTAVAQKRPRLPPQSSRGGSGGGTSDDNDGGGWTKAGGSRKVKPMVPGEAKARALAVVKAFVATLPSVEYGRDEGWLETKEEAREAARASAARAGGGGGGGGAGSKRDRAGGEKGDGQQAREKKPKRLGKSSREERRREERESKHRLSQMKSSLEPIWKQHRRIKEKKSGDAGGGGVGTSDGVVGKGSAAAAAGGQSVGNKENQIQAGRKLTQRLGKASTESKFSKGEVLEVLQRLGDLDPSVELLQQSGCGKAVSSVRKHFFGGQVKHNDKDVATAASSLRTRWMDALGKSPASAATAPGGTPTVVAAGASSVDTKPAPLSQVPAFSRARSDSNQHQSSSKKKNASAARRSGDESPRVRSPKTEWRLGVGKESKGRENGGGRGSGSGDAGGSDVGGRYGSSVQHGEEKGSGGGVVGKKVLKKEIKKEVKKEMAAPAAAKMPPIVSMDEPRRRAMGMLMSVLGLMGPAVERCTAIEEELYQNQERSITKEYLRLLRVAVFTMEGSDSQRLRDKVMSEMILPRDFVSKSRDEMRALAGLL